MLSPVPAMGVGSAPRSSRKDTEEDDISGGLWVEEGGRIMVPGLWWGLCVKAGPGGEGGRVTFTGHVREPPFLRCGLLHSILAQLTELP